MSPARRLANTVLIAFAFVRGTADAQTLPDPTVTPGAVVYYTRMQGCAFNHSTPRLNSESYHGIARYVFGLYHIPYDQHGKYELDHLIPRCLGGADEVRNLWPQPIEEARVKDVVEARICRAVCNAGTMSIEDGQAYFRDLKWAYNWDPPEGD
jgi:hypothetical protein